jgi:hypothetical protein
MVDEKKNAPVADTEVEFTCDCTFAGEDLEKGAKIKVTKARAELLKKRGLIK